MPDDTSTRSTTAGQRWPGTWRALALICIVGALVLAVCLSQSLAVAQLQALAVLGLVFDVVGALYLATSELHATAGLLRYLTQIATVGLVPAAMVFGYDLVTRGLPQAIPHTVEAWILIGLVVTVVGSRAYWSRWEKVAALRLVAALLTVLTWITLGVIEAQAVCNRLGHLPSEPDGAVCVPIRNPIGLLDGRHLLDLALGLFSRPDELNVFAVAFMFAVTYGALLSAPLLMRLADVVKDRRRMDMAGGALLIVGFMLQSLQYLRSMLTL